MTEKRYGNIIGWGKYIPERVLTNQDLEQMLDTTDEWIVQRTGIRERHIVAPDEHTSDMATAAAREALAVAGIQARDLDLIIVATTTPDHLCPQVSSKVQDNLGAKDTPALQMVVGCPGFVYGLVTAQQFIAAGTYGTILVIGVEIISRFVDPTDRSMMVLFGDGAGAVIVQATDEKCGVLSHVLGSDGSKYDKLIMPSGGAKLRPSEETLAKGLHYLRMEGNTVFKFATRVLGKALKQAIAAAGLTSDDIDLFIPHQANKRIIDSAARRAKLPPEKVFVNIHKYGNTSAASIPIALCEAIAEGRTKPGDTLAFVSFGAGLTWAAAVVKLGERTMPIPVRNWPQRLPAWVRWPAKKSLAPVLALLGALLVPLTGWVVRLRAQVRA
ncbi:MAG: beta-ketoacyl-ACP synthase III [Anaerolineales bacterium]